MREAVVMPLIRLCADDGEEKKRRQTIITLRLSPSHSLGVYMSPLFVAARYIAVGNSQRTVCV